MSSSPFEYTTIKPTRIQILEHCFVLSEDKTYND